MTPIASSKQRKTRSRSDSIGPATTPDIQTNSSSSLFNTPSFESDLFNSTLQFKVSNVSNNNNSFIRSRKHVISDSDEEESIEEDGQDEEEEEEDSEMKYLGLSMISFSFLAFIFGFWSIAIGPFLNLTGIQVSHYLSLPSSPPPVLPSLTNQFGKVLIICCLLFSCRYFLVMTLGTRFNGSR